MSVSGRCSGISRADGRNASLEHIMVEFTASTCPSLRGKPRLFFPSAFQRDILGKRWVLSLRKQKLYRKGYREVALHFHQWERQLPRRSRLSAYLCDFYISSWSTQQRTRVFFLSSWRISHHFIIAGGEGRWRILGGGITMFSGEKRWKSVVANRTSWKTFENWLQMRGNH